MAKLLDIEGVGEKYSQKLKDAGVGSSKGLLAQGKTPKSRKELAEKTGISDTLILKWVNHVDLFRINGIGEEYADLLEAAGVDTVPELAQRKAGNLFEKLVATNNEKKLVRKLPTQTQVAAWIEHAKELPRVITY